MLVIGLTGGIGTGKSEVSRILRELGATIIDADLVGHEAYRPHSAAWQDVVVTFGEQVLQPSGEIDRRRLGSIVFSDPAELGKLNAIMHPRMAEMIQAEIGRHRDEGVEVVVVEAAVLVEAGWEYLVDQVWVTHSPEDQVVDRIHRRNSLPEEEIRKRIRSQLSFEDRSRHAHATLSNSGTVDDLREEVRALWRSNVTGAPT
jgi:dephospho-CoA kinase